MVTTIWILLFLYLCCLLGSEIIGTCCCGGSGTFCCNDCAQIPFQWLLVVAGIFDGTDCEFCSQYNGTFILKWTGQGPILPSCNWSDFRQLVPNCGPQELGQCTGHTTWSLGYSAPNWFLSPNVDFAPTYSLPGSQWRCLESNTLLLQIPADTTDCDGWPETLTVVPGESVIDGCTCLICEVSPNQWSVNLSGIIPALCEPPLSCGSLNGNHILDRIDQCSWRKNIIVCGFSGSITLFFSLACQLAFLRIFSAVCEKEYVLPLSSFNCMSANVMQSSTYVGCGPNAYCANYPATVTVVPV